MTPGGKSRTLILLLVVLLFLNIVLLGSVVALVTVLRQAMARSDTLSGEIEAIRAQRKVLEVSIRPPPPSAQEVAPPSLSERKDTQPSVESTEPNPLLVRPFIEEIPILDNLEMTDLVKRRAKMPNAVDAQVLRTGDIDSLQTNPTWNPNGRVLNPEQRHELALLLKDHQFYAWRSRDQRVQSVILPSLDAMRERGAYIEYDSDSGPPVLEGERVAHTHSEPTDNPAISRLFVFTEEEFPDQFHAATVEQQRSLETFVKMYELINK